MFVKYTPKIPHIKIIPLLPIKDKKDDSKGYALDNDSVMLRPGTNELSEKEWEAVQPHIADLIGKEIVVIDTPAKSKAGSKGKQAKSLKDVPVKTARLIIEGCQDPNTLKKWFNQELPDELLLVVSKRMRKLKIEPEDLKDDVNLDELKGKTTPEADTEPEDDEETADEGEETADEGEGEGEEETEGEGDTEPEDDEDDIPDFDGTKQGGKK